MHAMAQQHIVAAPVKVKNSQQQIIDQLHQQCQQNDALIMLHGGDGYGKTTIAELFLEQASDYAECAFVTANERSTVDRLRAQILNQLFGTISLSDETLSRQIQRQQPLRHAVIVIDNGQQLPDSFLAECVATVSQLSAIGQRVSIIIAADSRWAYQQKPAPHLRLQGPVMLEIQPLSKDEQVRLVQALLPDRLKRLWSLDRIQQFLSTINGYPGEIQQRLQLALATQAQRYKDAPAEPQEHDDSISEDDVTLSDNAPTGGRSIKLRYIIACALALSLVMGAYLNRQPLLDWWQAQTASEPEPQQPVAQQTAAEPQPEAERPELPKFEPLTQQTLELMPADLAISYRDALSDLNRVAAAENDPRELDVALIKQQPVAQPNEAEAPVATPKLPYQTDDIAARDPQRFGLQIAVISTEALLGEFRSDYQLAEITEVYQRNDGRFVISYGNFDSLQQARAGVAQLPEAVQQMEPWAKSFAAMQAEINQPEQE